MKFKQKKVSKYRGSKTHGGGSMKKRRGAGNRGGRGMAGTGKRADQKKPTIIKLYGNSYLGKKGFFKHNAKKVKAINLKDIQLMINKGQIDQKVDLGKLGYNKLLGIGHLTSKVEITVDCASAKVAEKVQKAGGKLILPTVKE